MMTEQEFWAVLAAVPESQPVSYRLYYDDQGRPVHYTMEDLPGNYVEIDRETYVIADSWVRVVDGKIKRLTRYTTQKLIPGDDGTPCHPCNVAIVDPASATKWSKQTYGFEKD